MLALTGQGRLDQLPAGDLGYFKLVGRLAGGARRPRRRRPGHRGGGGAVLRPLRPVGGAGRVARAAQRREPSRAAPGRLKAPRSARRRRACPARRSARRRQAWTARRSARRRQAWTARRSAGGRQAWTGETTSWSPHGEIRGAGRSDSRRHRDPDHPGTADIAVAAVRQMRAWAYSLLVTKLIPKCALAPGPSVTVRGAGSVSGKKPWPWLTCSASVWPAAIQQPRRPDSRAAGRPAPRRCAAPRSAPGGRWPPPFPHRTAPAPRRRTSFARRRRAACSPSRWWWWRLRPAWRSSASCRSRPWLPRRAPPPSLPRARLSVGRPSATS